MHKNRRLAMKTALAQLGEIAEFHRRELSKAEALFRELLVEDDHVPRPPALDDRIELASAQLQETRAKSQLAERRVRDATERLEEFDRDAAVRR